MNNYKIALVHCAKSAGYKLVKLKKEVNRNHPSIMWVFESSKIKTAKKIVKNMNMARTLSLSDPGMVL